MLYGFGVLFVWTLGEAHCAVRQPDAAVFSDYENDAPASPSTAPGELDPRNQAFASSYSVVETAGRSTGPSYLSYYRSEYEPVIENTENRLTGSSGDEENRSSYSLLDDDDDTFESRALGYDEARRRAAERNPSFKERQQRQKRLRKQRPRPTQAPPKSISDIVDEGKPLQGAGSSKLPKRKSDLKKSGSYLGGGVGDSFEEGYDKEKHYDKEGGKKFIEAHKAEKGENAHQGYKKEEAYDKAEDHKHDKERKKAALSKKEGEKKGHLEQEKQYGEQYKGNQGEKGISVTKKGGHKKGKKKSGFHNVHHKDEYKKDEVFYEDYNDGEEHEEHAHEHEKHAKEKGGSAKKNHIDSQYHEGHAEKKGAHDKGHKFEEASGHKKEAAEEGHHDKHSEYGKKGGVKEGEKHGHEEDGSSGGGYSDHGSF